MKLQEKYPVYHAMCHHCYAMRFFGIFADCQSQLPVEFTDEI